MDGCEARSKTARIPRKNYIITTITASGCNESPQTRHLTLPGTPLAYAPRLDRQISLLLGNRRRNPVCRRPKPTPCPNEHALPDTQPAHSRSCAGTPKARPAACRPRRPRSCSRGAAVVHRVHGPMLPRGVAFLGNCQAPRRVPPHPPLHPPATRT